MSNNPDGPANWTILASYRSSGHLAANLDPLGLTPRGEVPMGIPELCLQVRDDGKPRLGSHVISSSTELETLLAATYSGRIGYEFAHIDDATERAWLYDTVEALESVQAAPALQRRLARTLLAAEAFDHFMAKRFGQVKRYGLEGGEGMMVVLDIILHIAKAEHVVIGMPHRGRLNLMVGLLGYPPEAIFHKLSGASELEASGDSRSKGSADVLSHLSHTGIINVANQSRKVSILPNPSHLEAINPMQQGVVYALQALRGEATTLAVQIHGDAAFSGQGIVQETLQMSQLAGFAVGGTVHLIVNNQLGYTATPELGRSARYASAPAKLIGAPIIHVNGDSPEDVARATTVAMQYRQRFRKDVVIDLICYRRHGHNELDEPAFTQPSMYRAIHAIPTLPAAYAVSLVKEGIFSTEDVTAIKETTFKQLDKALQAAATFKPAKSGIQKDIKFPSEGQRDAMSESETALREAAEQSIQLPPGFIVHNRLQKYHIDARISMLKDGRVDWATAEAMAVGSLLKSGFNVRLVGQDVQRGTFSQRHFVFHDQQTNDQVIPFDNWSKAKGRLEVINSHLSELAVLGFEYGVSITDPLRTLCIWEAQFGDFFNGAQIVLDTMVSSGETKWDLQSGLVMLLPHGYDGTGPEHSSCRLERFLQMSNAPYDPKASFQPNWHVVHPTTPANYFHLLQRQMQSPFRRPLIVASPKTLLRLPAAISLLSDLSKDTTFQPLLDDPRAPAKVDKLVFVSGKFYYEIERERAARKAEKMVIVRIEELCPLPTTQIEAVLAKYKSARSIVWCQEEHRNMGPYDYIAPRLAALLPPNVQLKYVGRPEAAAPAAGYPQLHKAELAAIWTALF